MTSQELIILALEQLRDGSYSPDRRERCQGLIEEMKMADYCTCDTEPQEEHTCPFAEEIHDSDDFCNCCEYCEHQCCMDI